MRQNWKYLTETGIAKCISVMSGVSVGTLNAALFAVCPYDRSEQIWGHTVQEKILIPQDASEQALEDTLSDIADGFFASALSSTGTLIANGIWSRSGLLEVMREIPLEHLQRSDTPSIYTVCCAVHPAYGTTYFRLNQHSCQNIHKILLASSAIPLVFKPEILDGVLYYDGGLSCNVPVEPISREQCTDVLIVSLSPNDSITALPGIHTIIIRPSVPLGKLGVLDFSSERIRQLIQLGYEDCKQTLQKEAHSAVSFSHFDYKPPDLCPSSPQPPLA